MMILVRIVIPLSTYLAKCDSLLIIFTIFIFFSENGMSQRKGVKNTIENFDMKQLTGK